jgi:transposase
MARQAEESTTYKVKIHLNNGYRYASTQPLVVDPERTSGRNRHRRIHWGTVDEDNKFHPNKTYLYADVSERRKLIFPDDWDMSEVASLPSERKAGRPSCDDDDSNKLYGDIWLLEQIAGKTGLRKDLEEALGGNREMADAIMTLAMFHITTGNTFNRAAHWQRIERVPYRRPLTSPDITYLTQSITEQHRMDLFRLRAARTKDGDLCAVDSTTRSAYGSSLADIKWGRNKERLPLEQTTEVVVYDLNTHMPIYYRTFPGNIPDSRSVETILLDLRHAGFPLLVLITDRGYESVRNMERYILDGQPLIMWVKVRQKMVLDRIRAFGSFIHSPEGMEVDEDSRIYYRQYDIDYKVEVRSGVEKDADRLRLNLYFDPMRRSEELTSLDVAIKHQRAALEDIRQGGLPVDDDESIRKNYPYFTVKIKDDDRTLVSYELNTKKVEEAKLSSGFYANLTHRLDLNPMQALDAYSLRDEQEKLFEQQKGPLGCDRQRNWSEDGKNGRLFIMFVALIMSSYLKYVWKTTDLKKSFCSSLEILDEMRSIRIVEHKGKAKHITPFVGRQLDICEAFGFPVPDNCAPKYKSKKVKAKGPGRPPKPNVISEEG